MKNKFRPFLKQIKNNNECSYPLKTTIAVIFAAIILLNQNIYAENDAGARASFTRGGWAGAKYVAMGKAAEVIVNDVYAIYWNPAGLRELMRKESLNSEEITRRASTGDIESLSEDDLLKFSEEEYSEFFIQIGVSSAVLDIDREAGFAGTAFSMFGGVLGIGYYGIQSRDIESRDESGNYIKDMNYSASTGFLSYGWGTGVTSLGVSVKGLYEKIGDLGYYGFGADIGTQIELVPLVKIGFVVQDIGTGLKPEKNYENIENKYTFSSPVFKLSASITNRASDFVTSFTGIKKLEQSDFELNFGIEYDILKYTSVYLGLNDSLFTSGVTLRFLEMDISYAFSFDKVDYGYNNMVSITLTI